MGLFLERRSEKALFVGAIRRSKQVPRQAGRLVECTKAQHRTAGEIQQAIGAVSCLHGVLFALTLRVSRLDELVVKGLHKGFHGSFEDQTGKAAERGSPEEARFRVEEDFAV